MQEITHRLLQPWEHIRFQTGAETIAAGAGTGVLAELLGAAVPGAVYGAGAGLLASPFIAQQFFPDHPFTQNINKTAMDHRIAASKLADIYSTRADFPNYAEQYGFRGPAQQGTMQKLLADMMSYDINVADPYAVPAKPETGVLDDIKIGTKKHEFETKEKAEKWAKELQKLNPDRPVTLKGNEVHLGPPPDKGPDKDPKKKNWKDKLKEKTMKELKKTPERLARTGRKLAPWQILNELESEVTGTHTTPINWLTGIPGLLGSGIFGDKVEWHGVPTITENIMDYNEKVPFFGFPEDTETYWPWDLEVSPPYKRTITETIPEQLKNIFHMIKEEGGKQLGELGDKVKKGFHTIPGESGSTESEVIHVDDINWGVEGPKRWPSQIDDEHVMDLLLARRRGEEKYKEVDILKELLSHGKTKEELMQWLGEDIELVPKDYPKEGFKKGGPVRGYKNGGYVKGYQQGGDVGVEYPGILPIDLGEEWNIYDVNQDGVVDVLDAVGGQEQGWTDNALQMLVNQIIPPTGGTEGGGFTHPGGAVSPPSGGGFGEPTPNYNPYNPATPVTGAGQYLVPPAVGAQSISPGEKPVSFADEGPSTWDYNGDGFIDLLDIWAAMQAGASQEYIQNIQGWIGGGGIATPPGPPAPGSGTGMNITPGEGPTGYNELGGGSSWWGQGGGVGPSLPYPTPNPTPVQGIKNFNQMPPVGTGETEGMNYIDPNTGPQWGGGGEPPVTDPVYNPQQLPGQKKPWGAAGGGYVPLRGLLR